MRHALAAAAILLSGLSPLFLAQNQGSLGDDVLVFERPGNRWYEGALTRISISADGNSAIFFDGLGSTELYSLATGHAEPETLSGGLDGLDAAGFCGLNGFLRVGNRGTESGIFLPGEKGCGTFDFAQRCHPSLFARWSRNCVLQVHLTRSLRVRRHAGELSGVSCERQSESDGVFS